MSTPMKDVSESMKSLLAMGQSGSPKRETDSPGVRQQIHSVTNYQTITHTNSFFKYTGGNKVHDENLQSHGSADRARS